MLESLANNVVDNWTKKDCLKIGKFLFLTKSAVRDCFKSEEQMNVIVDYLLSTNICDICTIDDVIYIKFSQSSINVKFSDQDSNLLKLHSLRNTILQQTKDLEKNISDVRISIKRLIRDGSKSQAKVQLKRMKRMQSTLEKKLTILDNIERILQSIESASDQAEVVKAYKAGIDALRNELGRSENKEEASELVQDIKYYIDEVAEISDAISGEGILDGGDPISDTEINREFEMLLSDESLSHDNDLIRALNDLKVVNEDPNETNSVRDREDKKYLNISTPECS